MSKKESKTIPDRMVAPELTRAQLADFLECYRGEMTVDELKKFLRSQFADCLAARVLEVTPR